MPGVPVLVVHVQGGLVRLAEQVALGQRRPLVGPLGLRAEQDDGSAEPVLAQRLSRLGAGQAGADDHVGRAFRHGCSFAGISTAQVVHLHRSSARHQARSAAQLLQWHRRACHVTADVSVSVATWSTTTRSRPVSFLAASYPGRSAGSRVSGAPIAHRGRQLHDQLPFPGLHGRGAVPAHHVVGGDPLEQRAFQPLPPRDLQVGRVPGERLAAGRRPWWPGGPPRTAARSARWSGSSARPGTAGRRRTRPASRAARAVRRIPRPARPGWPTPDVSTGSAVSSLMAFRSAPVGQRPRA